MPKPRRECGSCRHWNKWHDDGRGLCKKLDCAGKADAGRGCRHWKGQKYHRHNKELSGAGASGAVSDDAHAPDGLLDEFSKAAQAGEGDI